MSADTTKIKTEYPISIDIQELAQWVRDERDRCYDLAMKTAEKRMDGAKTVMSPRELEVMGNAFGTVFYKMLGVLGDE